MASHYHPIGFSRRDAERPSSQRFFNFWPLLSFMQTAPNLLDVKFNFSPVLSALSAPLREIYMGCYCVPFYVLDGTADILPYSLSSCIPNPVRMARFWIFYIDASAAVLW